MFVDLVDSTPLAEELGPERFRSVIRTFQQHVREAVENWSGYIAQLTGDGILAYFGYPTAQAEHARLAIESSLSIVGALSSWSDLSGFGTARRLQVRIACHSGKLIAETPNIAGGASPAEGVAIALAARLQTEAAANTVIASADCLALAEGYFEAKDLGVRSLKGISRPVRVFEIQGKRSNITRFEAAHGDRLTPLIGRDQELAILREEISRSISPLGRCVVIAGEAGVGKSRLVEELRRELSEEASPYLVMQCESVLQNTAFGPFLALLERSVRATRALDEPEDVNALGEQLIQRHLSDRGLDPGFAAIVQILLSEPSRAPASANPIERQKQIKAFIKRYILSYADRQICLVIEDIHWADPSTIEMLIELTTSGLPSGALLILTTRSIESHMGRILRSATLLNLPPLGIAHSQRILTSLGGAELRPDVIQQIISWSDGIPLFIEECLRARLKYNSSAWDENVPERLQGLVWQRLDQLQERKWIAQLASVIGPSFSLEWLRKAAATIDLSPDSAETVEDAISQCKENDLIKGSDPHDDNQLSFRHALIHKAAYESLPNETRAKWHGAVADIFETAEDRPLFGVPPEVIARHRSEAGQAREANRAFQLAGRQALSRFANTEAVALLTRAIEEARKVQDPDTATELEAEARALMNAALLAQKGWAAAELEENGRALLRAAQSLGAFRRAFDAHRMLFNVALLRADPLRASDHLAGMSEFAAKSRALDDQMVTDRCAGAMQFFLEGDFTQAEVFLIQSLEVFEREKHGVGRELYDLDGEVAIRSVYSWVSWFRGQPDTARQQAIEAIQLARELCHPFSLAYSLCLGGSTLVSVGDYDEAIAASNDAKELALRYRMDYWLAYAEVIAGAALLPRDPSSALTILANARARYEDTGAQLIIPWILWLEARGQLVENQRSSALSILSRAESYPIKAFHGLVAGLKSSLIDHNK